MTIIESSNGIPDSVKSGSQWTLCLVDGCELAWDTTPPALDQNTLVAVFGAGVMTSVALNAHCQEVEELLDRHLRTHSVVDWAKTVSRLKRLVRES